ncbi:hypothetical protein B4133_0633 [Bacillus altitudinis]|nr:hypothetical protein B4133_0633 [Bacillus altitudinis]PYH25289.1 hypothetical protein US8_03952 [Bacillus altitudinis]
MRIAPFTSCTFHIMYMIFSQPIWLHNFYFIQKREKEKHFI